MLGTLVTQRNNEITSNVVMEFPMIRQWTWLYLSLIKTFVNNVKTGKCFGITHYLTTFKSKHKPQFTARL